MLVINRNEAAPHVAVISFKYQLMEKLPSGELTGDPVAQDNVLLHISGSTRAEAERKLASAIDSIRKS